MNRLVLVCSLLILAAISFGYLWFDSTPPCRVPDQKLSDYGKLAYQFLGEMNAYLISLATLLLGSLGVIGMKLNSIVHENDKLHVRWVLSIAGVLSIASLAYALFGHIYLIESAINACPGFSEKLTFTQGMQILTLSFGAVGALYLIFVFVGIERRE